MDKFATAFNQDGFIQNTAPQEAGLQESSISSSWARCSSYGLKPADKPVDAVTSNVELYGIQQKNERIRKFVLPELQLLYNQIAGTNFMVAYADTSGIVLDAFLDEDFKKSDAGRAVIPGSIWTEDYRGTNALGLALHSGAPQIVAGKDHFFKKLGNLSCFAAPIYGQNNEIVGVIDATSDAASRQQHTLALVKLASKNVENRLFIDQFSDSSILVFHARHEYLSTTSAALLAIDDHGFIDGANTNAKIMLNGLNLFNKQHFGDIFSVPFSTVINRLNSDEIIRIQDAMGSEVFMSIKKNIAKRIVHLPIKSGLNRNLQYEQSTINVVAKKEAHHEVTPPEYISEDPILKRYLSFAENALKHQLPVFISGKRGTGKNATAIELAKRFLQKKAYIEIDCTQLTTENYEKLLFGATEKRGYFSQETQCHPLGKLGQAYGGVAIISNIEILPEIIQHTIIQLIEAHQENRFDDKFKSIGGFLFSSQYSIHDLQSNINMSAAFLESLIGAQVQLPDLKQRTDFDKIAIELLRQISPRHQLSKASMDALRSRDWPGHIGQLKKVLRVLVATTEGQIIRNASIQTDQTLSGSEVLACDACAQSSVRKESCKLIKKTWLETGGNVSLVSRRLGVSRTTVYKHIKDV